MQATEREGFERALGTLCAGYDIPLTDLRRDAYWRGLQKMSLAEFERVIDHVLADPESKRIPSSSALWNMHHEIRRHARSARAPEALPAPEYDGFHGFGQRALLADLRTRGAVDGPTLTRLIAAKNRVIDAMRSIHSEDPVTADEVRTALQTEFARARSPA